LLFFLGVLLHLLDLLLELGAAVLLKPCKLLSNENNAAFEVFRHDGGRNAEQGELLNDDQVQGECLLVLDNFLLLLTLLFSGSTDRNAVSILTILLRLGNLYFTVSELLVDLFLDGFFNERGLGLASDCFVVNNEASTHLQCVEIANEMLTAVQLLLVRVG